MKTQFIFAIALALIPASSFAQKDERAPGVYTIVDGQSIPLEFKYATASVVGENRMGAEITYHLYRYKGESAAVAAGDSFVMVIDPKLKEVVRKMKEFNPFIRAMKPSNVIIIPLEINSELQCREYATGLALDGMRLEKKERMDFEWKEISDNSFEMKIQDFPPGEYGFVFRPVGIMGFDYTAIFEFRIQEQTDTQ